MIENARGGPMAPTAQNGVDDHRFNEIALALRAQRQALIAANIANADTPNFQAKDMDFAAALREATKLAHGAVARPATTHAGHLQGESVEPARAVAAIFYRAPTQPALDGNTVDLPAENARFAQNSIMYTFAAQRALGEYREMVEWLKKLT